MNKPTAQQLVDAALETLKEDGFAGATSRAIARRAGVNQALVFYHFGSVDSLLLAALDRTSETRLAAYREALEDVHTLEDLGAVAARLYEDDLASGHITVVSQMIAGSLARPELAPQVVARLEPWLEFAEQALTRVAGGALPLPAKDLAYGVITFYLGVNLLSHLDEDDQRSRALFTRIEELTKLAGAFLTPRDGRE
jgi:AcrR family transcriptional regulator